LHRFNSHNNRPHNGPSDLVVDLPRALHLGRTGKFLFLYTCALTISSWLAYQLRFDFDVPDEVNASISFVIGWTVPVQLFWLYVFKQFRFLPAYFGPPALQRMFCALFIAAGCIGVVRWQFGIVVAPPRGVILVDSMLAFLLLTSLFMLWRFYRQRSLPEAFEAPPKSGKRRLRVAIVGAGEAGFALARELRQHDELGLEPVAFFDDDKTKWHARVLELPVLGPPELLGNNLAPAYGLDEIIISMPAASAVRIREIVDILRWSGLQFRTVPSLGELALGRYQISQIRDIEIQDLLGREPVCLQASEIRQMLQGRRVLVTGAGGSIGSELCRQIAAQQPDKLLMVERSEVQMFMAEKELIRYGHRDIIEPLVVDILDETRLRKMFRTYQPDLVFHAAAHKHVPMMERQPDEAVRNNALGTAQVAKLSLEFGVERFVLISTDKAIKPSSVMGATKRLAEMILQDLQAGHPHATSFMAVRFGNVLGSSGSVVPLFREQIAMGGPVKVTHPGMTRYFMTIPEAVGLVLQSSVLGAGGDIFLLDMGEPVRILDLARQMIKLSGLEPDRDIQIEFVGVRPGEKLFEELSYADEAVTPTSHAKIMRLRGTSPPDARFMQQMLGALNSELDDAESDRLKHLLKQAVPEYRYALGPASLNTGSALDATTPVAAHELGRP